MARSSLQPIHPSNVGDSVRHRISSLVVTVARAACLTRRLTRATLQRSLSESGFVVVDQVRKRVCDRFSHDASRCPSCRLDLWQASRCPSWCVFWALKGWEKRAGGVTCDDALVVASREACSARPQGFLSVLTTRLTEMVESIAGLPSACGGWRPGRGGGKRDRSRSFQAMP